tara:strand:- start:441 stop:689 length:249 start_codon:yes stop_codon:yes gene_type:complete
MMRNFFIVIRWFEKNYFKIIFTLFIFVVLYFFLSITIPIFEFLKFFFEGIDYIVKFIEELEKNIEDFDLEKKNNKRQFDHDV